MNIVIGKTIGGEFLIGKLEEKNNTMVLKEVYNLIIQPDPKNQQQLRTLMIPIMMPFDDKAIKEVSIDKFILSVMEAPEEVQNTYIKLTTGLDVVSSRSKIIQ